MMRHASIEIYTEGWHTRKPDVIINFDDGMVRRRLHRLPTPWEARGAKTNSAGRNHTQPSRGWFYRVHRKISRHSVIRQLGDLS